MIIYILLYSRVRYKLLLLHSFFSPEIILSFLYAVPAFVRTRTARFYTRKRHADRWYRIVEGFGAVVRTGHTKFTYNIRFHVRSRQNKKK